MSKKTEVGHVIAFLEEFNCKSEDVFINLAEELPMLLSEFDDDLSPWARSRSDLLDESTHVLYGLKDFFKLSYDEDNYIFARTHDNVNLTIDTGEDSKNISKKEKIINKLLRKAEREFVSLFTLSELLSDDSQDHINAKLFPVIKFLQEFDQQMTDTLHKAKEVAKPILNTMEVIQNQDIMRQSVQHAIMVLEEYDNEENLSDDLEKLTFKIDLIKLTIQVLDEVEKIIFSASDVFDFELKNLDNILTAVNTEREELDALFSVQGKDFNKIFPSVKSGATLLKQNYARYIERRSRIIKIHLSVLRKAQRMLDEVGSDEQKLSDMESIQKVVVAEMQTVHDAAEETLGDHEGFNDLLERLLSVNDALNLLNQEIYSVVKEQSIYTHNFLDYLATVKIRIDSISELIEILLKVHHELTQLMKVAEKAQKDLLKARGLDEWELKSDRIVELASHFTIASQKAAAGEIVGFEVEDGIDNGEIILF